MNKYDVKGLNNLSKQLNEFVKSVGFDDNDIPLRMMLIVSEISEAFEAFRKDKYAEPVDRFNWFEDWNNNEKSLDRANFKVYFKDTFEDELAGSIIRLLDLCGKLNIDIEWHIQQKMKYNETRGHKYGGKKF